MSEKTLRTVKSFVKLIVYTFVFVAASQIAAGDTLNIDWKAAAIAGVLAAVKAALTWFGTPNPEGAK